MKRENVFNAKNAPQPRGGYSQAVRLEDFQRLLFVSGQMPRNSDDTVPAGSRRRHVRSGSTSMRS